MDREHSILAPSSAGRWRHCPGSVAAEAAAVLPIDTEQADVGEAAHWACEQLLDGVNTLGQCAPNGHPIDAEIMEAVEIYAADILRTAPRSALHIEDRVDIHKVHPKCFGTPDCFAYEPQTNCLYIWDYKHGHGIVEAEDNSQGVCYASGIIAKLGLSVRGLTIRFRIVQPRGFHRDGPVREWRFGALELLNHIGELRAAAEEALGNSPGLFSGEHCRYCAGRHACPALSGAAYYACDLSHRFEIDELTGANLGAEYRLLSSALDRLQYRITGIEQQLESRIRSGDLTTGYCLERAFGRKIWDRSPEEIFALGDLLGIDLRKEPEPCTPTQAEKKGIDSTVISAYASKKPAKEKLVLSDDTRAKRAFTREV